MCTVDKYHFVKFLIEVCYRDHKKLEPDDNKAEYWISWLKQMIKSFRKSSPPEVLLEAIGREENTFLGKECEMMILDIRYRKNDVSETYLKRRNDWIRRRDEGNAIVRARIAKDKCDRLKRESEESDRLYETRKQKDYAEFDKTVSEWMKKRAQIIADQFQ